MASSHGNLILSVKHEEVKGQEYLHVILRSRMKTMYDRISLAELPELPSVPQLAKVTKPQHSYYRNHRGPPYFWRIWFIEIR
uniref:Uncharacterized protein n=1 Tax=Hucho hucho TaxID=62062 RepID=A0A4W5KH88_9TELE